MSYRAMGTMYATAGLGRMGPRGYAPPWRPSGFRSFQGLAGAAGDTATVEVRAVQRVLIAKGFNVGSSGADGTWGAQSENAFAAAAGRVAFAALGAAQGARGAQTITMPEATWRRVNMLPNRAAGTGTGPTGKQSHEAPADTTRTPTRTAPGDGTQPLVAPGLDVPEWLPYALGGAALLGLGGLFLWQGRGKKRRAPAKPAAVTANRRRRRRSSRRRR